MSKPVNIVVWADKGGVGKTTLATSFQAELGASLVDLDPQKDATRWAKGQALVEKDPKALVGVLQAPGLRVVDCPPGQSAIAMTAVALADILLIPTRTGDADMVALSRSLAVARKVQEIRPEMQVGLVLNLVRETGRAKGVEIALRSQAGQGFQFLGRMCARVAVEEAYSQGRTLLQVGGAAAHEFRQVLEAVRDMLPENTDSIETVIPN